MGSQYLETYIYRAYFVNGLNCNFSILDVTFINNHVKKKFLNLRRYYIKFIKLLGDC